MQQPHSSSQLKASQPKKDKKKNSILQQQERQSGQEYIMSESCSFSEGSSDGHEESDPKCMTDDSFSEKSSDVKDHPLDKIVDMHLKALEDLVNVNSLFTIAVFIGLSIATPNQPSLENRRICVADAVVAQKLVMYEVLSFAFFLVSSLAAKSLKVLLNIFQMEKQFDIKVIVKFYSPSLKELFRSRLWRRTMLLISTGASAIGVFFLTLSMVNVIQIKLGKLSCGNFYASISVLSLTVLVLFALMLYLPPMIYAALATFRPPIKGKGSNGGEARQEEYKVMEATPEWF